MTRPNDALRIGLLQYIEPGSYSHTNLKGLKSSSRQLQADYRDFYRAGKTVFARCEIFHSVHSNNEPMSLAVLSDLRVPLLRVFFQTSKFRAVVNVFFDPNFPKRRKLTTILKYVLENIV